MKGTWQQCKTRVTVWKQVKAGHFQRSFVLPVGMRQSGLGQLAEVCLGRSGVD